MKQTIVVGGALVIGVIVGIIGYYLIGAGGDMTAEGKASGGDDEPLYWVAPMDPNFRRDEPGKSPMGMDLVPVYAEDETDKGTIRVSPAVEHSIGVRTAPVRRGRLHDELTTVAFVQYDEELLWHAYPRVDGWIDRLYVESVGEEIESGDPLYDIYSPMLVNAQEEYASAIAADNRTLIDSAEERLRSLNVPRAYLDRIREQGTISQSITMRAQQTGVVSSLAVREGHYVTPGTEIMEIAGLGRVWVTAEVFESDVASVDVGDAIEFRFGYQPGEVYRARIDFIHPVLEAMTRTLQVRASVPNPHRKLKPNMFAEATIHVEGEDEVLLVPQEAVIRTESRDRVVLARGDGRYKSVAVRVGRVTDEQAEVLEGLEDGDQIVTSAQFLIDSESNITSDLQRMDPTSAMDADSMDRTSTSEHAMDGDAVDEMDHSKMNHDATNDDMNMDTEHEEGH